MTTTKTASPTSELLKLERARENAYAPVAELKRQRQEHEDETQAMRVALSARTQRYPEEVVGENKVPKEGTETAKLAAEIRARMSTENPYEQDFRTAQAKFHEADEALTQFKLKNIRPRVEEGREDCVPAIETIQKGFELVKRGCAEYLVGLESSVAVAHDTSVLDGRDVGHDPRVHDWFKQAQAVLESEIILPQLTELGEWKADQHG